ncbi:MAG: hypothetical protein JXB46_01970 [Candidatus Eisenbacteria bacterium]|nr:hypothetical protein [Candidatus Eisenbacteria bacterium]
MSHEIVREIAENSAGLAALHHLAAAVLISIFWMRRRSMERAVAVYFAVAFATCCFALFSRPETRVLAVMSALLSALWVYEVVKVRNSLTFRGTPRFRLAVMAALWLFAFVYPGHSGELPSFMFSSLGVTLAPTIIAALATMNAAAPFTNRPLHWSLAVSGAMIGAVGVLSEGIVHVPLLVASGYAVPLLLGRAKIVEGRSQVTETSMRAVADRIHERRVLFTKARRTSVRRLNIRKRR